MNEQKVLLAGAIFGAADFERLQRFAKRRGFTHRASGKTNMSKALRTVVAAGLRTLEAERVEPSSAGK